MMRGVRCTLRVAFFLCLFPFAGFARAEQPIDSAVYRISKVETFAIGGVGFAGVITKGELDYRAIMLESPERALQILNKLYSEGDAQAKCYAMLGIRKLDPARSKELYHETTSSREPVRVARGCIFSDEKLLDVVKEISEGKFSHGK